MQREPMIYAVAGMIFGFVLGLMVAGAGDGSPAPGGSARRPAAALSPASGEERHPPGAHTASTPLDPDEVRALESLAARDRTNVEVRVQLANLLMDHAEYDKASRWLREVLALKPGDANALVDLGACLLHTGKPGDALSQFEAALKSDPGHKKALFNKGLALVQGGRPRDALAVWEDLLKRYPGDPQLQGLKEEVERLRAQTQGTS